MPISSSLRFACIALLSMVFCNMPVRAQTPPVVAPTTPTAPAVVPAAPSPLPARGTYRINGDAKALSVFAVSVDAQELFTAIADRANIPVLIDDTISRRITFSIDAKPVREIIDDIVSAYGLSAADVGGVLMISEGIPRSPSSYLLSDISQIPTKYVNAANARNLLPVFLQDYVKVNSEQNAVVLSAPTEVLNKFKEDIAQFDIPASQILVELLLVELTDTSLDSLGLNFTIQNADRGISIDPSQGLVNFQAITNLPYQFTANINALQEKGRARVRANPRIATVSGRLASIFVGRQRYVVTPIQLDTGESKNFIDAGVRLNITPYTGGKGQILVDVDAEVSTLSAPDPTTKLPTKSTRTTKTTVRVGDGQTIVIGGLEQQEARETRSKIPLLGDLPILGGLFRSKAATTTKTELVLFVTTRILSSTGHLPEAEEKLLKERLLNSDLNKANIAPVPPIKRMGNGLPQPDLPAPEKSGKK